MTAETSLAFAHPLARAEATAAAEPLDRISLRDYVVTVEIGAFQVERGAAQRVRFNVVVEVRPQSGPVDDDVDRILSYESVVQAIDRELAAERVNLLETLAERIAGRVLLEPQAVRVFVRVEKLDIGPYALGVEIVRSRTEPLVRRGGGHDGAVQHPVVVYLSNAAIGAPDLSAQLDHLAADGRPVILCVGLPSEALPQSGNRPVQRRIDLLAMGQNAWVLAGRDKRCVVVDSRTEIEWAMRQGRMVVWAPAKLVLDAPDGPVSASRNGVLLAHWLADLLQADRLLVIADPTGHSLDALPAGSRVPVETRPVAGLSSAALRA